MSDDNILSFPSDRELDATPRASGVSPERVLCDAHGIADTFETALVVGLLKDGTLYVADTQDHFGDTLLIMERVKQALMGSFADDNLSSDHPPGTPA